jgi:hypothetical protein
MCFWCPDAVFLWHLCFAIKTAGFKQYIGIRSISQCLQSLLVQCFWYEKCSPSCLIFGVIICSENGRTQFWRNGMWDGCVQVL